MKGKVPGRKPRIFPFVGHGNDVFIIEVLPIRVPAIFSPCGRRRSCGVAGQPGAHVKMIKLFAPQHSRKCLTLNILGIGGMARSEAFGKKFVRLLLARGENGFELFPQLAFGRREVGQSQSVSDALSGGNQRVIMDRSLRSHLCGIYGPWCAGDDIVIDPVFDIGAGVGHSIEPLRVGVIFGKEHVRSAFA